MPLRRFWLMSKTVDRINAEDDIRQLQLMMASQSGDAVKKLSDQLRKQMGEVAVIEGNTSLRQNEIDSILNAKPEPGAFERLRGLARAF